MMTTKHAMMRPTCSGLLRKRLVWLTVSLWLLACPVSGHLAVTEGLAGLAGLAGATTESNATESLPNATNVTGIDNIEEYLECQYAMEEPLPGGHCAAAFDTVLCWPHQPPGSLAVQNCFAELRGVVYDYVGRNATRWCLDNGTWDTYSNYSGCMVELMSGEPGIEVTSTIYYVGYTISTIALAVAVTIFSHFRELHCLRNRIHMNLMLAYIGADIVWIVNLTVNIYLTEYINKPIICFIFVFLLHYTMLTHFLWMFVEGLYLYTLVVKTFQQGAAKLPVYLVIGWGAPLVVVMVWVGTRLLHPSDLEGISQNVDDLSKCPWWVYHWSDWIYQAPCIAVLAVNSIFMVFIMYVLIAKLRSDSSMRPGRGLRGPSGDEQQATKAAKALLVLIPLLGITYILVIAGPTEGSAANVFAHARALLLSTQGLLVALFYCFLNTDVRHTLRSRWERWKEMRMVGRHRNGRTASVNWTNKDSESCITGQVGDKSPATFKNGHDLQNQRLRSANVSWLSGQSVSPISVEGHGHM